MPQIERPTQRRPLKDLPLSLFIHPEHLKSTALLGKKRPYSPSSVVSPSKRRLLAVEGVLSPRSPFKRAVVDLQRALPSTSSPGRVLLDEFQKTPDPLSASARRPPPLLPFDNPRPRKGGLLKPQPGGLGSSIQLMPHQPKPRVAEAPSTEEAELLAILAAAPKSTQVYLPGAGQGRPMRNKEDDPEEDHYPGFDIYVDDETTESSVQEMTEAKVSIDIDAGAEDEQEASKENQQPFDNSIGRRFSTPSLSARSSMSSIGFAPTRLGGRRRLRREVDEDALSSDDDFL